MKPSTEATSGALRELLPLRLPRPRGGSPHRLGFLALRKQVEGSPVDGRHPASSFPTGTGAAGAAGPSSCCPAQLGERSHQGAFVESGL